MGAPPPPSVGAHAPYMKVLVADDDDAMRLLIEAVLATAGHEVVSAADGDAAWAAFERERPPLMLLDWHMPKCSGIELCERVREGPAARATFIPTIHTPTPMRRPRGFVVPKPKHLFGSPSRKLFAVAFWKSARGV